MIPFSNLKRQHSAIASQIHAATEKVLKCGWYILGKEVETFERHFAEYIGSKHCVGVANGTDAITLALMAQGIGVGDEVITTALTAYPTITGIERAGATPIIVDVYKKDGLINPACITSKITKRTRAIVAVHLYGKCCQMDALQKISTQHHLALIEDCAQSCGASYDGNKAGSIGSIGCFSFYPTKNLGACGDGGAVVTNSKSITQQLRMLRNYGQSDRYHHQLNGLNSRLDEIQAAILTIKLAQLDRWNLRRQKIATTYQHHLSKTVTILSNCHNHGHIYHLFVIRVPSRTQFMQQMDDLGVQTLIHYPVAVHQQPAMAQCCNAQPSLANAEMLANEVVSLPIYPELTDEEVITIINAVLAATSNPIPQATK